MALSYEALVSEMEKLSERLEDKEGCIDCDCVATMLNDLLEGATASDIVDYLGLDDDEGA